VIMVDHHGEIVDGDELLYIIAQSRLKNEGLQAPVVGTLMSNLGLEQALAQLNIPLLRAKVGDRYVMAMLTQHHGILGGENSGHLICLDRTTTGDGIVAALQVLAAMHDSGQNLHQLKSAMAKYPQILINVPTTEKINPTQIPSLMTAVAEVEHQLGTQGRVLLRASGTEPLIRVMVEGLDTNTVNTLAYQLADVVKKAMIA
jgi:phosphoglucosamine mutase